MFLGFLTITVGYFGFEIYDFAKGVQADIAKGKNHFPRDSLFMKKIGNGIWVSSKDSLATVRIDGHKWTFEYENDKTDSTDLYDYLIFKNENTEFLTLSNKTDTLKYELDYLTDNELSIIYLPRGNYHNYERID